MFIYFGLGDHVLLVKMQVKILVICIYTYIKLFMYDKLLFNWSLFSLFLFLFFHQKKAHKSFEKFFLFYEKGYFYPCDIEIVVLHFTSFFARFGYCLIYRKSWLKLNYEVYDVIISIIWILKAQILSYLDQ